MSTQFGPESQNKHIWCAASELNLLRTIIMRAYVVGVWDYCAELRARMMNLTAKGLFQLQ